MGKYDNRLATAIDAAKAAGSYLLEILNDKRDISKKGVVDIVTDADKGAEKIIHEIINIEFPQDQFLPRRAPRIRGSADSPGLSIPWTAPRTMPIDSRYFAYLSGWSRMASRF